MIFRVILRPLIRKMSELQESIEDYTVQVIELSKLVSSVSAVTRENREALNDLTRAFNDLVNQISVDPDEELFDVDYRNNDTEDDVFN